MSFVVHCRDDPSIVFYSDLNDAAMSVQERYEIVCSMRQTALAIIESSLPPSLTREQRRYAIVQRMYGEELPEAALWAHAKHPD